MASILLANLSSAVGSAYGGAAFATFGKAVGSFAGRYLDSQMLGSKARTKYVGAKLAELSMQTSSFGKMIPIIYGKSRIAGNVIWLDKFTEHEKRNVVKTGGIKQEIVSYDYTVNLAIALCEGEINSIEKIWVNDELYPNLKYTLYTGGEDQLPDPLMEMKLGAGNVPAYRGIAYVVIEDFLITKYNNQIPNFTFEVTKLEKSEIEKSISEKLSSLVMSPGCGEFVYDSNRIYKISSLKIGDMYIKNGKRTRINENNRKNIPDAILALNQCQQDFPNLKWAAPVVCWFIDSLDIEKSTIAPRVEFKDDYLTEPYEWNVAGISRRKAREIMKDGEGRPLYGGTISDNSILNYLDELKRRDLKIMFYPMLMVEAQDKPWRGRISGNAEAISAFFNKRDGYKNFILHYANLVKGRVDAFIIGSELIGLTSVVHGANFPAVDELISLAKEVKEILGEEVIVTYAADWSEYHHTNSGYYNLDKLWMSKYIDVIGIDAYFPLTEEIEDEHDKNKILKAWDSGPLYDYYYDKDNIKKQLTPNYAIKNIEYWYNNEHINPDNTKSPWIPKSKKIWFTEFGFPSVDNCANQPNIFYNPESSEGGLPKFSEGNIDFLSQKIAILATLERWQNSDIVTNMFLWCYDARPYPYWPDLSKVWSDGYVWSRGHFVNGKFGTSSLASIIQDLSLRAGFKLEEIDVSRLKAEVEGYAITNITSAKDEIDFFSKAFFFGIRENKGLLEFIPKNTGKKIASINKNQLAISSNQKNLYNIEIQDEKSLPTKVEVIFISKFDNYDQMNMSALVHQNYNNEILELHLPIVMSNPFAKKIANMHLSSIRDARYEYKFSLTPDFHFLKCMDLITLDINNIKHKIRINKITIGVNDEIEIEGTSENSIKFKLDSITPEKLESYEIIESSLEIIPIIFYYEKMTYLGAYSEDKIFKGASIYIAKDEEGEFKRLCDISKEASIFTVIEIGECSAKLALKGTVDNELQIEDILAKEKKAYIEGKIVTFADIKQIEENIFEIDTKLEESDLFKELIIINNRLIELERIDNLSIKIV